MTGLGKSHSVLKVPCESLDKVTQFLYVVHQLVVFSKFGVQLAQVGMGCTGSWPIANSPGRK